MVNGLPEERGSVVASGVMSADKPPLFDTHVHLDYFHRSGRLEAEIDRAKQAGVGAFVVPGVSRGGWRGLFAVVDRVPEAQAAPGIHPLHADQWGADTEVELAGLLGRSVAAGEIGLDGFLETPPPAVQERAFRGQLRLAVEMKRPVLIHCRKRAGRVLEILRQEQAQRVGGVFHGFSASAEVANEAIRLGFALGIGGVITYPNARRLPEVVRQVPPEWLVVETDAPDMLPHPLRDDENRPANLALIVGRLAALLGLSEAETARLTTANAQRVLGI